MRYLPARGSAFVAGASPLLVESAVDAMIYLCPLNADRRAIEKVNGMTSVLIVRR